MQFNSNFLLLLGGLALVALAAWRVAYKVQPRHPQDTTLRLHPSIERRLPGRTDAGEDQRIDRLIDAELTRLGCGTSVQERLAWTAERSRGLSALEVLDRLEALPDLAGRMAVQRVLAELAPLTRFSRPAT